MCFQEILPVKLTILLVSLKRVSLAPVLNTDLRINVVPKQDASATCMFVPYCPGQVIGLGKCLEK